jgi:phage/plasmid-associated DNA primase
VIEFRTRFVDDPQTADERQRDSKLIETLKQEHSGILAWLVRGHLDWRRGGLQTPESVKVARDTYRNEESIEPFVAACCYESIEASAEASVLYEGYKRWCEARGYRAKSTTWFGRQARAIYEKGRTATGRACYYGIGLLPDDEWTNPSGGTNSSETLRGASGSQETPAETDAPEGFGTVSKSFCHGVLVKENNMENASDPSDPSGETDKTTEHPPCTPDEPSASGAAPEPPEGWQLVRCDHRGNVTRFGAYWRAVHDDGTMADVTQYPDSAARLAWAAQARE